MAFFGICFLLILPSKLNNLQVPKMKAKFHVIGYLKLFDPQMHIFL